MFLGIPLLSSLFSEHLPQHVFKRSPAQQLYFLSTYLSMFLSIPLLS
jgi:hypothetical protein